jgi:hypothetical protein
VNEEFGASTKNVCTSEESGERERERNTEEKVE